MKASAAAAAPGAAMRKNTRDTAAPRIGIPEYPDLKSIVDIISARVPEKSQKIPVPRNRDSKIEAGSAWNSG